MHDGVLLAKRCPQCGRLLARDSQRCGYCLAEVWDVEAAEVDGAPQAVAGRQPLLEGARRSALRLVSLPKWLLLLAVLVLAAGGWFLYQSLKPERTLALPTSAARSLPPSTSIWPATDGNALHTRHTDVSLDLGTMQEVWSTELGVTTGGAPVADSQRLYLTTTDNRVIALNVEDGSPVWAFEERAPIGEAPIAAGDRVYLVTRAGAAVCLNAATGAEIWRTPLPTHFFNSPTLVDGVLYAFGTSEALYGLDSEDGRLLWTVGTGSDWATLPPVVTGRQIILATGNSVNVYDRKSGSLTLEHPQNHVTGLALSQGSIISVSSNFIAQVDPTAHLPWWWGARGAWFQTWVWGLAPEPPRFGLEWLTNLRPPVKPLESVPDVFPAALADGTAVVANAAGAVRALDTATGGERWSVQTEPVTGAPVWTASGILVPLTDALSLRSPADGSEVARYPLPQTPHRTAVVTAQGTYLVSADGSVVALR
jgi:outer membrane protein assembly factor BamB